MKQRERQDLDRDGTGLGTWDFRKAASAVMGARDVGRWMFTHQGLNPRSATHWLCDAGRATQCL